MRATLPPVLGMLFASALCTAKVFAQATEPIPVAPVADCRSAASAFEQSARLPSGLFLAIGQVESGRPDPMAGRIDPWPWATNHAGEGHYFTSAPEAIAWVAAQQASGNRSIDVGCFQVNLQYHPNAFSNLAEAFDPAANARYAAAFLSRLHEQSGNWPSAIALYHSADPFEGQRYSTRVMEVWNTGGRMAGISLAGGLRSGNPVVVRLSALASAVRVVVPNWAMAQPLAALPVPSAGLPRVITPSR